MMDVLIMIMVEVLSVLALATKQIKQGRFSKPFIVRTFLTPNFAQGNSERNY